MTNMDGADFGVSPGFTTPVGLSIWLADLTYTQQTIAADVMPNAIGCIATFTETQVPLSQPIRLFKYPEALAYVRRILRQAIADVFNID